jgi:hypothetical protein
MCLRREGMRWKYELEKGGRVGCDAHVSTSGWATGQLQLQWQRRVYDFGGHVDPWHV